MVKCQPLFIWSHVKRVTIIVSNSRNFLHTYVFTFPQRKLLLSSPIHTQRPHCKRKRTILKASLHQQPQTANPCLSFSYWNFIYFSLYFWLSSLEFSLFKAIVPLWFFRNVHIFEGSYLGTLSKRIKEATMLKFEKSVCVPHIQNCCIFFRAALPKSLHSVGFNTFCQGLSGTAKKKMEEHADNIFTQF